MPTRKPIELGDEVKEKVTGFKGIAVARVKWITGCDQITVLAKVDKEGKVGDQHSFDEPMIEVVRRKVVKPIVSAPESNEKTQEVSKVKTGGPRPSVGSYMR